MGSVSKLTASGLFLALLFYLLSSSSHIKSSPLNSAQASTLRRSILRKILAENHQLVPALDQNLRYVGRWLPTSNRLRWDTAFPGAYFDFIVRNASTIYISLDNAPVVSKTGESQDQARIQGMSLKTSADRVTGAAPISLVVTVCNGNHNHFASSEDGLVAIHLNARPGQNDCSVRVSHAGGSLQEGGVFQFSGLWLPAGASLQPGASMHNHSLAGSETAVNSFSKMSAPFRKTVELLTDSSDRGFGGSTAYTVDWLAQSAAYFDADQVKIPAHDHCLTEPCTKILGYSTSTQDMFFRSGPAGTSFFPRPWNFQQYVPDALVLDLGTVDHKTLLQSSAEHRNSHAELRDTRQSLESITNSFITAYMDFIQQIRRAAYPLHPSALHGYALDGDGYTYNSAPSTLPIFVMRPLSGSFEHATLSLVEQMQKDGDKSVFWIDTRGWLSDVDYSSENTNQQDRVLTATGHAKVTSFMNAHLCHYLAPQPAHCPFLRRDDYMGNVYVPIEAELDKGIEESKVKKLTELFWGVE